MWNQETTKNRSGLHRHFMQGQFPKSQKQDKKIDVL